MHHDLTLYTCSHQPRISVDSIIERHRTKATSNGLKKETIESLEDAPDVIKAHKRKRGDTAAADEEEDEGDDEEDAEEESGDEGGLKFKNLTYPTELCVTDIICSLRRWIRNGSRFRWRL